MEKEDIEDMFKVPLSPAELAQRSEKLSAAFTKCALKVAEALEVTRGLDKVLAKLTTVHEAAALALVRGV